MRNSFIDILRIPDSILFQYEDSDIRFEEPTSREARADEFSYRKINGAFRFTLYPSGRPIMRIKLRWNGDLSSVISVIGDTYERIYDISYGAQNSVFWHSILPDHDLGWYFHTYDGEALHSYGVKTGASAFASFRCDPTGISLWLDIRNGGGGTVIREPLDLVDVVSREGVIGENPYFASVEFCKMMCDNPVVPKTPFFGVNNWYWAYGNISHESVMRETDYLMELSSRAKNKPFMVIDDGWQSTRYKVKDDSYNGGPWLESSEAFPSMRETAARIHDKGAYAGLWFRPLLTQKQCLDEMVSPGRQAKHGITLDPSHPLVLEIIENDVKNIVDWGYDLIKHDFTTLDTLGIGAKMVDGMDHFFDRSIPNCKILLNLYEKIQAAAGDKLIIGCNTINHNVAGIHAAQRSGHDTSGRSYEITRAAATSSLLRLPQNGTFFNIDPDCPAFTDMVPIEANLDFLELCAKTSVVTLASVTPGILKGEELKRAQKIFEYASVGGSGYYPTDWLMHNAPMKYTNGMDTFTIDWFKTYEGTRSVYTWMR